MIDKKNKVLTLSDLSRSHRLREEEIKSGKRVVPTDAETSKLRDDLNTRMMNVMEKIRNVEAESWVDFKNFLIS